MNVVVDCMHSVRGTESMQCIGQNIAFFAIVIIVTVMKFYIRIVTAGGMLTGSMNAHGNIDLGY